MEVHHHAHTARKKWTHYFWEFLMLFLAVFCGFMAEYQLEHKIEKDREKQYVRHLLEDLRTDTAVLAASIRDLEAHHRRNDSLIQMLMSDSRDKQLADLYYLGRHASRGPRLAIQDATFQQLKNSGGLRLISKADVARAIVEYYNRLVFIDYLQHISNEEAQEYRKQATAVFHPVVFNQMIRPDNAIARPEGNPALLTNDPNTLTRLAGMVSYINNTKLGLKLAESDMKEACQGLIALVEKEYRIR